MLTQEAGGEMFLKDALEPVLARYAFILIDCPPNLGKLTINALTAADGVILPLTPAYLSLNPMNQLLQTVEVVKKRLNPMYIRTSPSRMAARRERMIRAVVDTPAVGVEFLF
jgi:cellulose biosynthesis protein BcsQ